MGAISNRFGVSAFVQFYLAADSFHVIKIFLAPRESAALFKQFTANLMLIKLKKQALFFTCHLEAILTVSTETAKTSDLSVNVPVRLPAFC